MAKDPRVLMFSAGGFAAGLYVFYRGFYWLNRKRLIEDIPTSKIRSIAMGLVEISGKAKPAAKEERTSPLSGKKCVYYKYSVEKLVQSGKSSHWQVVSSGYSPEPFYVEDSTGKIMIDPKYAELSLPLSYNGRSKWGKDPDPHVKNFLQKENIRFEGALFGANHDMRYTEWIITPGMELYIMGTADDNPYVEEATAKEGVEDVIIKKGHEGIMMISNKKERQVLSSLKWKSLGYMAGGVVISLICLIIMIAYFSL